MTVFFLLSFTLLTFILITPNTIHGLLGLILLFCNFAFLLFSFKLPFLGFAYILVYIGAICVLFLYIILLLNLRTYSLVQRVNFYLLGVLTLCFSIFFGIFLLSKENSLISTSLSSVIPVSDLALYTHHLFISHQIYLIFSMLLLLVALILALFVASNLDRKQETTYLYKNI